MMAKRPLSASRRKLGIRARFGYIIGAVLAALWIFFFSIPETHHAFFELVWTDGSVNADGTIIPPRQLVRQGYQTVLLLVALVGFGLFGYTTLRVSPSYWKWNRVFVIAAGIAFTCYVFAGRLPSPHSDFNAYNGLDWLNNRAYEIWHWGRHGSADLGYHHWRWWHGYLFLVAFSLLTGAAGDFRKNRVFAVFPVLLVVILVIYDVDYRWKTALYMVAFPFIIFPFFPFISSLREYLKETPLYRRLFVHGRGGSARFGGIYSFIKYDFNEVVTGEELAKAPVYGGRTQFEDDPKLGCRHIGLDSDSMMLTVAAMGGGKSLYSAWNTLLLWKGGALILDPKGEHADMTAAQRRRFGEVHFLAPWTDRFERATYNPLEDIDLNHANARADLFKIVQACIPQEPGETANSKHFRENAQRILLGIMAHVLSESGPEYHNLPSIYDTILTGHPDGGAADPAAFDELVIQMAVNEAFGRAPMDAAKLLDSAGTNERGGFLTTLANGLSWANDEAIRPCITKSSFSMNDLRARRATVYVVIPFENMSENARYMRMVVGAALLACRVESPFTEHTLVLLDEFPQLGTFEPIKEGLVTLRSQKVKIWMMLQDIGQLKERYKNWQDFMSSCDKQFFAVNDDETAEAVRKGLGEYVDREGSIEKTRPLRSLSEVREDLRKGSGIQYLMPADGCPLKLNLVPAFKNFSSIKKSG